MIETNNPEEAFDALYKERLSLYMQSDLHVSISDESPEEVSLKILSNLPSILVDPKS